MIKTFIFDLGRVIVPIEIDKGMKFLENATNLSNDEVHEKIVEAGESRLFHEGKISAFEFYESVRNSMALQISFEEFADMWNGIFLFEPLISEELIKKLSEKYRLIILSDTNDLHFEFIKPKFPILRFFDDFVLSYKIGALKPSPKMYKAAVEKAECLPEECFFTDDRLENIEGAKKFGINAVQFLSAKQFETEIRSCKLLNF